ncbi:MAG: hypothetical protein ACI86M_003067 [Saprospiraceae bacterium]|jgi:hypothetical protein
MEIIINVFLAVLGIYFAIGLLFGLYFLVKGAPKIDPIMKDSQKKVRVLILPGVIATWPFLISRLFNTKTT